MRQFTPEEKELIVNTPITRECFDMSDFTKLQAVNENSSYVFDNDCIFDLLIDTLEALRRMYMYQYLIDLKTGNKKNNEKYFTELVRLLPNSYKVVKL